MQKCISFGAKCEHPSVKEEQLAKQHHCKHDMDEDLCRT
jgi:hypothetical protein